LLQELYNQYFNVLNAQRIGYIIVYYNINYNLIMMDNDKQSVEMILLLIIMYFLRVIYFDLSNNK